MSTSNCNHATCEGQFCRREKKPKERGKPIARFSKKREKINREYDKKAKAFREANLLCAIKMPGVCTVKTQAVNHKKGKATIELLMNEEFWEPSCFACNNAIEVHSQWAHENGHRLNKFL